MSTVRTDLRAGDVMTPDPVCVGPATTIRELACTFEVHEISGAPVVDQQGRLVGVVSKTDLIRRCAEGTADIPPAYLFEVLCKQSDPDEASEVIPEPLVCVEDFMTEDPLTVPPEMSVGAVARLMFDRAVHRVIVVDQQGLPVGIVTSMDMLCAIAQPKKHS